MTRPSTPDPPVITTVRPETSNIGSAVPGAACVIVGPAAMRLSWEVGALAQGTTRTSAAVTGGTYTVAVFPDVACMYGAPRFQTPSVVTVEPASVTCPAPADSEPAGVPCR